MTHAPLSPEDMTHLPQWLPGWSRVSVDGVVRLERTFDVPDYATAMSFTQLLSEMANAADHHPTVLMQRAHVTVAWWTVSTKSLTQLDLIMAERTDRLFEAMASGERRTAHRGAGEPVSPVGHCRTATPDTFERRPTRAAEER
jgi:4a-hydroxytetrahydrobiopterin dehydratase